MQKLIIHAGIHRTGTTSIQSALAANRTQLNEAGFLYPGTNDNHQEWAWGLLSKKKSAQELLNFINAEITDKTHTVVLSAEDFCIHKDLSWLQVLRNSFDVHVRIYTRRQEEWLMSWYNQHVKWPWDQAKSTLTPSEFLAAIDDFYWINFEWLVSNWSAILGNDHVHISPMGSDQAAAFLAEFFPDEGLTPPARGKNESVPTQALDILRHTNALNIGRWVRHRVMRAVMEVTTEQTVDPIFSQEQILYIRQRYAASNVAASNLLPKKDPIVAPERDISGSYQPLSDREIIDRMSLIVVNLARELVQTANKSKRTKQP